MLRSPRLVFGVAALLVAVVPFFGSPPMTTLASARAFTHGAQGTAGWQAPGQTAPLPPAAPPTGAIVANGLLPPVPGGIVTSGFGHRWGRPHEGIDVAADTGAPVVAALGGVVLEAGPYHGYGNRIVLDHGAGGTTSYSHLSAVHVTPGQPVPQGAVIGAVGCTGVCTGPHLHFEVRVHDIAQDPLPYIP